ncbi:UPF0182 family protein [cf. Phormidesmis sp. LEGE 11477]|uniref:UPF0182 family membrane protein n=1 Tax=cf. Phormidesmis sp. LEGE 11477 TaxID=1828680 RepID=UPI00188178C2|nr:UPF0182 family protein [cf. Phormidesmis sp. LEGE 11477]
MTTPLPNLSKTSSRSYAWIWWLIGILLLAIVSATTLIHLLTEYWWFSATGFTDVFQLRLGWSLLCAAIAFAAYGVVLGANFWLALWLTRDRPFYAPENSDWAPLIPSLITYGGISFIVILSLGAAQRGAQAWEALLKFLRPTAFNVVDPIYQQDVGFYIFRMPVYQGLQQQALELLFWALAITLTVYALRGEIRIERGWKYLLTGPVKTHLCAILSAIAITLALGYWLARYDLLYSATGVVFGAGYTDVNARLSAYTVMGFVTLVMAGLFIISLWRSGFSLPLTSVGIYLAVLLVVGGVYPTLQQTLTVEPNELDKEKPFIAHNLDFTRQAYGLSNVQREDFVVEDDLAAPALEQNTATLDNIRLWGYQTLLSTYQELQSLRLYYRFHDVDIDRYTLNGDYRQVMLSARELDYEAVPEKAQNWVNKRLKYTHGYGVAMSPVNQVTIEGLPDFFIKNIPPEASVDLTIDQPRIYYGEETDHYVYTGTSTEEFDYPLGNDNATNLYSGAGGVGIGSMFRRLTYAFEIGSLKPLISNYFTANSKIHYHRDITERARQIVPFLQLDSDPYLALIDGRFQWILDGYTTSDRYPYSEPIARSSSASEFLGSSSQLQDIASTGTNYIRDAAKIVIDAYDGTLTVYAIDETDPVLATYQKIFPTLFTPLSEASEDLRAHFRYPLNLFQIQSQMYRAYHMEDTEVFYNQEDLWQLPQQIGGNNNAEQMQPYYVIMRLPNAEGEEFLQILPFTPSRKDNMVAWMAARCDGDNYGQLVLYKFPKQVLVYGPQQIEARIDQNPDISEQLTLWNQQGSSVIRGNLLVIPVDQSLLYFEPVYLQADAGALPELKRVIVAFKNTIVMRQTLPEALDAIFGTQSAAAQPTEPSAATTPPSPNLTDAAIPASQREQVEAAIAAYEQGQSALQAGDWAAYGQSQERLGRLLQELNSEVSVEP